LGNAKVFSCLGGGLVGGGVWGSIGPPPPPKILLKKKEYKSLPKLSMGNRFIGICKVKHMKKFLSVFGGHIFSQEGDGPWLPFLTQKVQAFQ
jgi:hypothetical protein